MTRNQFFFEEWYFYIKEIKQLCRKAQGTARKKSENQQEYCANKPLTRHVTNHRETQTMKGKTTMPETDADTPEASADHRHSLRVALLIKKVRLDDQRRVFFGYATNISRSGFFISSVNPAPLGSRFTVEMTLPAPLDLTLCCECETIWRRTFSPKDTLEPGMGLRFVDLDEEISDRIDQWIKDQLEQL